MGNEGCGGILEHLGFAEALEHSLGEKNAKLANGYCFL